MIMWYDGLLEDMENARDSAQAEKMSAYMQNRFEFLGIPKPALKDIIKPYFQKSRKLPLDREFVLLCWEKPFREAQYTALEYLSVHKKELTKDDLGMLKRLITEKSWWETVDTIDAFVGLLVQKHPELKETMLEWSVSDNIWLRRTSIDFQQEYKQDTDTELLEKIIVRNLSSDEFFINKAIGWSLRDYSKVNADWVRSFIEKYKEKLAPLSVREGSKYL